MTKAKCRHGFEDCERCESSQEIVDMVNRPSHYNYGDIECIDAIQAMLSEEGFRAYCKGNSLKYLWRAGLKLNAEEDLKKAVWYTRMSNGDDPRLDPHQALREAASNFNKTVVDREIKVEGNEAFWSEAARLAGWTPPK